jgi:hypothetical protein
MKKFGIALVMFLVTLPVVVSAQSATFPFGGYITYVDYCDDGSTLLYVFDIRYKTVLPFIYSPYFSRLNAHYNIWKPGNRVMGSAFYGGVCLQIERETVIYGFDITGPVPLFPGIGTTGI